MRRERQRAPLQPRARPLGHRLRGWGPVRLSTPVRPASGEAGLVTQGFVRAARLLRTSPGRAERAWRGPPSQEPCNCTKEAPLAGSGLRAACGRHTVNTFTLENSLEGYPRETSVMRVKKCWQAVFPRLVAELALLVQYQMK